MYNWTLDYSECCPWHLLKSNNMLLCISEELENSFNVSKPKVIFCQSDKAEDIKLVLNKLDSEAQIVTFDNGDHLSFAGFLEKYGDDTTVDDYMYVTFFLLTYHIN